MLWTLIKQNKKIEEGEEENCNVNMVEIIVKKGHLSNSINKSKCLKI